MTDRPLRIQLHHSRRLWRGKLRREWWFTIVAANGRTLAHSEGYARRVDCLAAAQLVANTPIVVEDP